jgi:hypothetical protein
VENKNEVIRQNDNFGADRSLSKRQMLAILSLAIFAIIIFVLWGVEFRKNLFSSLKNNSNQTVATGNECPDGNCQNVLAEQEEKEKNQDTDKDGLSDWEELNTYGTSPYLADSDSDGISDSIEISNSTDPNCKQGSDCSADVILNDISSASSSSSLISSEDDIIKSNAAILRQALLEANALDEETLNQISDEDLLTIYQAVLEETASRTEE